MTKPLKCTSCNKAVAGIHVLDVQNQFDIVQSMHLCEDCATSMDVVPTKMSLQALIETHGAHMFVTSAEGRKVLGQGGPVCPGCHLTHAEFKLRGRLGCAQCYEVFRGSLVPLLERVHDGSSHHGRHPARYGAAPRPAPDLTALRARLTEAIAAERYEEAARLRDQIQKAEQGEGGSSE